MVRGPVVSCLSRPVGRWPEGHRIIDFPRGRQGPIVPGQLFTQYFLTDGIQQTAEWRVRPPVCSARSRSSGAPSRNGLTHSDATTTRTRRSPSRIWSVRSWSCWDGPTTCRSRARPVTRTSPIISFSPMLNPKRARRRAAAPTNGTRTPSWWRKASASACLSTRATGATGCSSTPRTARFSGIYRPRRPSPMGGFDGESSPMEQPGDCTTAAPGPARAATTRPTSARCWKRAMTTD